MIRKLLENNYLKRFDNMTKQEQDALVASAKEWCGKNGDNLLFIASRPAAAVQDLLQMGSTTLNDSDCMEIEKGISMLSAFAHTEWTWFPDAVYMKTAKRALKWICQNVQRIASAAQAPSEPVSETPSPAPATQKQKPTPAAPEKKPEPSPSNNSSAAPVRPKHIDQYVHLLPAETQKRAQSVKGLLRDLDEARENARLLSNSKDASQTDLARWAKKATRLDDEVRAIYAELDAEWDNLVKSGKVTVDDLGNARIVEAEPEKPKKEKKAETPKVKKAATTKKATAAKKKA